MNTDNNDYKYFAFISYSHQDKKWGDWLHKALETYKVPKRLIGTEGRDGAVPKRAFPIFRDREELPGSSDLGQNINDALQQSRYLVVICSPRSAKSKWVNEEIKTFKAMGREDRVLCLIVDGEPNATDKPEMNMEECFPEAVKYRVDTTCNLTDERTEPIAADAREGKDGKNNARIKLLAGVLGVAYDSLKQRDQARRMRRLQILTAASLVLMTTLTFLSVGFYQARNEAETARDLADNERSKAEVARSEAEESRDVAKEERSKAVQARNVADSERKKALTRLKENYRHLGHSAFLEDNPEHALLYFNEVRRIDKNEKRINLEMADAWASVSSQESLFPADEKENLRLDFSIDGTKLLSQNTSGQIKLIDLATGKSLAVSDASGSHMLNGEELHYSEKNHRIAAIIEKPDPDKPGHLLHQVKILNADGESSGIVLPDLQPDLLNISAQGTYLLTSTSEIGEESVSGIWSLNTNPPIFQPLTVEGSAENYVWRFSADDHHLFQIKFSGDQPYYINRRDADSGKILGRIDTPGRIEATAMHDDLAAFGCADGTLLVYRVSDGFMLWQDNSFHASNISSLSFSADGRFLLSVENFGKTALWDAVDLGDNPVWQIESHDGVTHAAELSSNAGIAAIAHGKSLSVYRVGKDVPLFFQDNHNARITDISLASDGSRVAVATASGEIRVWRVQNSEPREVITKLSSRTRRVAQNRDESFLAYGDALYGVWPTRGEVKKLADTITYNQTLFVEDNLIVDYNYGWISLIKYDDKGNVSKNDLRFENDWTSIPAGMMGVPPKNGPLVFVFAAPGDKLYGFNRAGKTLPQTLSLKKVRGNPLSVVFNTSGNKGAVSFTDNTLLNFSASAKGVTGSQWHAIPSTLKEVRIADWIGTGDTLLLQSTKHYYLYDLTKNKLKKIPRDNLVTALSLELNGRPMIVSINVQGTLEVWNSSGKLLAQNKVARENLESKELFTSSPLIVGKSMAKSSDNRVVAASINDRVYIWDIASGDLIWRSSPLETGFNSGLEIQGFINQNKNLIVGSKQNTELTSLTLGGKIPSLSRMDLYLKERLKLSLQGGRIIEQSGVQ